MKTVTIACSGADTLSIDDLADFQGDLKRLSDENYQKLRKQILELGFSEPFSVWKHGKKRYILNGHQRRITLLRMQTEGYEIPPLPVSWVKAKSIKDAKLKVLSLTSQYGEMTEEGLQGFVTDAELDMEKVAADFSFPEIDWSDIFEDGPTKGRTDGDAIPEPPVDPVSNSGEMYQLGNHRLMCGNAVKAKDIECLMQQDKASCVWTDPPYGVNNVGGNKDPNAPTYQSGPQIENDDLDPAALEDFITSALAIIFAHCKKGCALYLATPGTAPLQQFISAFNKSGFRFKHSLIWAKHAFVFGRADYHYQHEMILYGWAPGAHTFAGSRDQSTVFKLNAGDKKIPHPTSKPVELVERMIANNTEEGEIIADPFLGSGTTIIACEQLKRRCLGMEIEPAFCDIIRKRWAEYVHGAECDWETATPVITA